jgi:type IV pilus assembly protein PilM
MKLPTNLPSPTVKVGKLPSPKVKLGSPKLKLPSPKLKLPSPNLKLGSPKLKLGSLSGASLKLGAPSFKGLGKGLGRHAGSDVVGLDIQPGFVAAVEAHVNGTIVAARAATVPLAADTMRDGEVLDEAALGQALRELFAESKLGKRVRVGVANQRTVLRILELPPVTDHKELSAAVAFQAQDQVPMPLGNAVLDFHPLGIIDTPAGPRQRVVLVAAQRDMVERLLAAVRAAGLTPAGVDLSAFALIRSLYRPEAEQTGRVLYLNVDGLSNLAIAEGTICRFTRVVGSGLEGMASELAERRGISLLDARSRLAEADLTAPPLPEPAPPAPAGPETYADPEPLGGEQTAPLSAEEAAARERDMSYAELSALDSAAASEEAPAVSDEDVWAVLDNGIREISGEVRNSLDFHRSQDGGGEVSHVVLSGAAQDIPGFATALQGALGVEVREADVGVADGGLGSGVSPHRLAVATGLAATEAPQ